MENIQNNNEVENVNVTIENTEAVEKVHYEHVSGEPICFADDQFAGSEFVRCGLENCTFSQLNLSSAIFEDSNMENCEFARLSLSSVIFEE